MLVYLDRGELPEAVTLVLRRKGQYRVPASRDLRSRHGLSSCRLNWRVVELWTVPAEELLQTGDIGLVPWLPLTDFADPPEKMIERCRDLIDEGAPPGEKANLLAVTQVLAYLRYNSMELLEVLGGRKVMLEVPYLDEIVMEKSREAAQPRTGTLRRSSKPGLATFRAIWSRKSSRSSTKNNLRVSFDRPALAATWPNFAAR